MQLSGLKNISSFGGYSNNITIFGESDNFDDIDSKAAWTIKKNFNKAICQSGGH